MTLHISDPAPVGLPNIADQTPRYNAMQAVKRRFFAMRNGILADTLRKAGSPYPIIFGLNVPQLREIADSIGPDTELADRLHANATTRCSRLLAPMLHQPAIERSKAEQWLRDSLSTEETDLLCHNLLRRQPYAPALSRAILAEAVAQSPLWSAPSKDCPPEATPAFPAVAYGALRLMAGLQATGAVSADELLQAAQSLTDHPSGTVRSLAARIVFDFTPF